MSFLPFEIIDWSSIPEVAHKGETGSAISRTVQHEGLRIRIVEYSVDYKANHWCKLGHLIYCIDGEMITELDNGKSYHIKTGMSYHVSTGNSCHRSQSKNGTKLLIIDGVFLK